MLSHEAAVWILSVLFLITTLTSAISTMWALGLREENESLTQALIRANARSMT